MQDPMQDPLTCYPTMLGSPALDGKTRQERSVPLIFFSLTAVEWLGDIEEREHLLESGSSSDSSALSWVVLGRLLSFSELYFP